MTDKAAIPTGPIDVLDQAVDIRSAKLDSTDSGVAFFHDGEAFVFGIFENGAGHTTRMTPEVALAMGQALQEAAILAHADVAAVHRAVSDARDQIKH